VTRRSPKEKRKAAALATLAQLAPACIAAYTDGSVLDPVRLMRGGGGYTLADAAGVVHAGRCAAGRRCSSYRAELYALIKCADDLLAGRDDEGAAIALPGGGGRMRELRICLDSQSAIVALAKGAAAQTGELEQRA